MNRQPTRRAPVGAGILAWRAGHAGHTDWCARDHTCGLGEHRAQPVVLRVAGRASIVLTRVRATNGRQHVEIRTRVELGGTDIVARPRLAYVLRELETHLRRIAGPQ